jgi:hypothetical protein
LEVPKVISDALKDLRKNMRTCWGEEIEDPLALARHAAQLSQGFYYRWKWPNDEPDKEWLYARADWHRELRHHIKRNLPGIDSPFLVGAAIARGDLESETYAPWCAVRDRYRPCPPVETVWVHDFLINYILDWMKNNPGIVWISHRAVEHRLRQLGVRVFGRGKADSAAILTAKAGPIVCAMKPHSEGKNLQDRWSKNLVVSCPPSGKRWQQLIARTHRPGQLEDTVDVDVLLHTDELWAAWESAMKTAQYMHEVSDPAKLIIANRVGFDLPVKQAA